jgi:hypothetical protein
MLLYTSPDCTVPRGKESVYLDMQSAGVAVMSNGPWRSYSFTSD